MYFELCTSNINVHRTHRLRLDNHQTNLFRIYIYIYMNIYTIVFAMLQLMAFSPHNIADRVYGVWSVDPTNQLSKEEPPAKTINHPQEPSRLVELHQLARTVALPLLHHPTNIGSRLSAFAQFSLLIELLMPFVSNCVRKVRSHNNNENFQITSCASCLFLYADSLTYIINKKKIITKFLQRTFFYPIGFCVYIELSPHYKNCVRTFLCDRRVRDIQSTVLHLWIRDFFCVTIKSKHFKAKHV